jgi:hypothetical protein
VTSAALIGPLKAIKAKQKGGEGMVKDRAAGSYILYVWLIMNEMLDNLINSSVQVFSLNHL